MKVVLDASAALAGGLGRDPAPAILDVLAGATIVLAPEFYVAEVTSGLWKYVTAGQLPVDQAIDRLGFILKMVDRRQPAVDLTQEVLREAASRKHPVYDLFYAVLARREGATLLTLDTRLKKLAVAMGIPVLP